MTNDESEETMNQTPPNNSKVIHFVVITVCACTLMGVLTQAVCVILRIPDMGGHIGEGFSHVVDTLIGALIAMLINTRPQEQRPAEANPTSPTEPAPVVVANEPGDPVPVKTE